MAYHAKKRRTRARKHTLRSRRRTRGGEGKRKRLPPPELEFTADEEHAKTLRHIKDELPYLRKFFAPRSDDVVYVSAEDLTSHAALLKDLSDNYEKWIKVIDAAHPYDMDQASKDGNKLLITRVLTGKRDAEKLRNRKSVT